MKMSSFGADGESFICFRIDNKPDLKLLLVDYCTIQFHILQDRKLISDPQAQPKSFPVERLGMVELVFKIGDLRIDICSYVIRDSDNNRLTFLGDVAINGRLQGRILYSVSSPKNRTV